MNYYSFCHRNKNTFLLHLPPSSVHTGSFSPKDGDWICTQCRDLECVEQCRHFPIRLHNVVLKRMDSFSSVAFFFLFFFSISYSSSAHTYFLFSLSSMFHFLRFSSIFLISFPLLFTFSFTSSFSVFFHFLPSLSFDSSFLTLQLYFHNLKALHQKPPSIAS